MGIFIYDVTLNSRIDGYFYFIGVVRMGIGLVIIVGVPNKI